MTMMVKLSVQHGVIGDRGERLAALCPTQRLRGWTLGALGVNGNVKLISSIRVSWPRLSETAPVGGHCSLTGPASSLMNSTIDL